MSYLPLATGPIQANVDPETSAAFVQFAPIEDPRHPTLSGVRRTVPG